MKKVLALLSLFIVMSCGSDDDNNPPVNPYNFEMEVTVNNISIYEATISWNEPLASEWGNVIYEIVLNNEEILSGLQASEYTFTNLIQNKVYNGTVFASGSNGQQAFAHFSFTTQPNNFILEIAIENVSIYEATISWNEPPASEWGDVVYKVVLNDEVIADVYTQTEYTFTNLIDDTQYDGIVFAYGSNGQQIFEEFNFRTERSPYYPGILRITTQEEADNFFYIGVGGLEIIGNDIHDISGLEVLEGVGYSIKIQNTNLQNLNGLQNVISDPDDNTKLNIENNSLLNNISAINNFSQYCIDVAIQNNASLNDLTGFSVDMFSNDLIINNIPATDFSNFSNLRTVKTLHLFNLPSSSLNGFSNLESATYLRLLNIPVSNLSALSNISNLQWLELIDMNNLRNLQGINGISGLQTLKIDGNAPLENLNDLPNPASISNLILKNMNISDLTILSNFNTIGFLEISNLSNIQNMEGLGNLSSTYGFKFNSNPNLISLDGISNLNPSGSIELEIKSNISLTDFCQLRNKIAVGGITYVDNTLQYFVSGNAYNPTLEQIKTEAGCSQ